MGQTELNVRCHIGNLVFENPLVYGAGTCKIHDDVGKALSTAAAGVELGSITPLPRNGNEGSQLFFAYERDGVLIYTLNSLGMPNPGREAVAKWARDAILYAHNHGKLLGINIAADTVEEIVGMVIWAVEVGFDWVTINGGCPNKFKLVDGVQVPQAILSFDSHDTIALVDQLDAQMAGCTTEIWWKPSPDNDTLGTQMMNIEIIARSHVITGLVLNNTVPHAFAWRPNTHHKVPAIDVPGGFAGMGGPAVKPKSLGDIARVKEKYGDRFALIGAGGVTFDDDIAEYLACGATITQFTSAHWASDFDYHLPGEMLTVRRSPRARLTA